MDLNRGDAQTGRADDVWLGSECFVSTGQIHKICCTPEGFVTEVLHSLTIPTASGRNHN